MKTLKELISEKLEPKHWKDGSINMYGDREFIPGEVISLLHKLEKFCQKDTLTCRVNTPTNADLIITGYIDPAKGCVQVPTKVEEYKGYLNRKCLEIVYSFDDIEGYYCMTEFEYEDENISFNIYLEAGN